MTTPSESPLQRLQELQADRATQGLTPSEEAELAELCRQFPDASPDDLEPITARLDLALFPPTDASLPSELEALILAAAPQHLPPPTAPKTLTNSPSRWFSYVGWAIAALLAAGWLGTQLVPRFLLNPTNAYSQLLADSGTQRYTLLKSTHGIGELHWHPGQQKGYLRVKGLPPNNPSMSRYQLWIVDGTRTDPKHSQPIDGGLFDVNPDGTALVPVRPALPVGEATAFAITEEQPSGVVVSTAPHLMVLVAAK